MNDLLHNEILLKKIFIGVFVVLLLVIVILAYFAFSQDRTSKLDFDSVTINSDALPLTVPDYAGWVCNGFGAELPEDVLYSDLKQTLQTLLTDWRTRRPPQELLVHYTNEKNKLVELLNIFEDKHYQENKDELIIDGTDYAVAVAARWSRINNRYALTRNTIAKNVPQDIRAQLSELDCYLY